MRAQLVAEMPRHFVSSFSGERAPSRAARAAAAAAERQATGQRVSDQRSHEAHKTPGLPNAHPRRSRRSHAGRATRSACLPGASHPHHSPQRARQGGKHRTETFRPCRGDLSPRPLELGHAGRPVGRWRALHASIPASHPLRMSHNPPHGLPSARDTAHGAKGRAPRGEAPRGRAYTKQPLHQEKAETCSRPPSRGQAGDDGARLSRHWHDVNRVSARSAERLPARAPSRPRRAPPRPASPLVASPAATPRTRSSTAALSGPFRPPPPNPARQGLPSPP